MNKEFSTSARTGPTIYAYEDTNPQYAGLLKVGYTTVETQGRVTASISHLATRQIALSHPARRTGHAEWQARFSPTMMFTGCCVST